MVISNPLDAFKRQDASARSVLPSHEQGKGYPFEVELPAGMKVEGVVLCDQLKSLDWKARHARRIGSLPGRSIKEIQARILALVQ